MLIMMKCGAFLMKFTNLVSRPKIVPGFIGGHCHSKFIFDE